MNTKLLDVRGTDHYWEHLQEAAEALKKGEIVAFPTETVYGLGVNAVLETAVAGLQRLKQRPQEKEFARLIAGLEEIRPILEKAPYQARLLIEEFWPGPLTIVLAGLDGKDIGIRFPDHRVAQDLVRLAGVPVLATSANISGEPPAKSAQEVMKTMGGKLSVILDAGPSPLGIASTVIRVNRGLCKILRVGAIPVEKVLSCLKERVEVV